MGNDAALWWRVATVAASVLAVLAAAGVLLYYLSSPLFFEILDPRGITVRQALGSLVATAVTAAFVKYIVQRESRAAREQADKSAMDALQTDAAAIVRAYAAVQNFYIDRTEAPRSLADRAASLLGRKQEAAKGIDRVIWRSLLSILGSGGINAHLQFLSQVITPNTVEPISRYLQNRANFAFELREANADDQLEELYMVLFSKIEKLSIVDSVPLLDTRIKGSSVLTALARLLQAMQALGLSVDCFEEIKEQADFAYHRAQEYFDTEVNDAEAVATTI